MQEALDRLYAPAGEWLGTLYDEAAVRAGVLAEPAPAVRARWAAEVQALASECGLEVGDG
jgi:1,2-phenylacetyl-CoA epoxidase catalytic subunit